MMYYKKISIKISLYTREHRIEKHYLKKVERKLIKEQNLCKIEDGRYFKLKSVLHTARKKEHIWNFSGPCFPVLGLNMDIYFVNLPAQN